MTQTWSHILGIQFIWSAQYMYCNTMYKITAPRVTGPEAFPSPVVHKALHTLLLTDPTTTPTGQDVLEDTAAEHEGGAVESPGLYAGRAISDLNSQTYRPHQSNKICEKGGGLRRVTVLAVSRETSAHRNAGSTATPQQANTELIQK